IKNGATFFNEIEMATKASPTLINRNLAELEKEGLIVVELDRSTGRRRPRYKLNEAKKDEIEKLIQAYLEYEKREAKEKLKIVSNYITLTEEEKKVIEGFLKKLEK
ncbi:MAG: helix-turn-helix domain-containing protein, partial [Archaeoglobaceae archaeon]|nr:helix-turn-helix domain-containing protein [Archaeoglobaceae archaeon]